MLANGIFIARTFRAKMPHDDNHRSIALNRKAKYNYFITETYEAGIVLTGSEVKSLRLGKANIEEAHAGESGGELFLYNMNISEYAGARHFGHDPRRPRKLLLKSKEIQKLLGLIQRKGYTLIPLSIYFNKRGIVKIALGLAEGKKQHDKRQTIKERDWNRDKERIFKNK